MSKYKYDYFIAGSWVNHRNIEQVLNKIRASGKKAYCYIENEYNSGGIKQSRHPSDKELAKSNTEDVSDWKTNPTFRKMFDNDMDGLKNSEALVLVLPAGLSSHIELGVAYGLGKKCYGVGKPSKTESLYLMFEDIFPTAGEFLGQLA